MPLHLAPVHSAVAALVVGGLAGAFNAALTDNLRFLPTRVRTPPPSAAIRAVRPGLIGNVLVGAFAAIAVIWGLADAPGGHNDLLVRVLVAGAFVGFVTARWASNEADKTLLRGAVLRACAAPAAPPEVVRAIQVAWPYGVYTLAGQLMPRQAGRR